MQFDFVIWLIIIGFFLNKLFRGKFLVYDHDEGIIGRDVLNEFSINFDGVNLEWTRQSQSTTARGGGLFFCALEGAPLLANLHPH